MAAYNEDKTIRKAIESIRNQTFDDWELIVVNDGSTDGTESIVSKAALEDSRIVLLNKDKNTGLASSLNKGIAISSGDYIARMDADDLSLRDRLRLQVDCLDNNLDIVVLGGAAIYQDAHGNILGKVYMPEKHRDIVKWLLRSSPFIHPSVMMRRAFLQTTQGYDESLKRAQDYDLWFRGKDIGQYHNIQTPILTYVQKEKKSLRSLFDSYRVRRKNISGMKDSLTSMYWLAVNFIMRILKN